MAVEESAPKPPWAKNPPTHSASSLVLDVRRPISRPSMFLGPMGRPYPRQVWSAAVPTRRTRWMPVVIGILAVALLVLLAGLLYHRANQGLTSKARDQVRDDTALAAQLVGEQTLRFCETVQARAGEL